MTVRAPKLPTDRHLLFFQIRSYIWSQFGYRTFLLKSYWNSENIGLPKSRADISNGHKNGANISVQRKIFPKLKAQIIQIWYLNVQEGSSFTAGRKNCKIFNLSSCFHQSRIKKI